MLTDKFLESKSNSNSDGDVYSRNVDEDNCDTPLNRMFVIGCCLVVSINVGIWFVLIKYKYY